MQLERIVLVGAGGHAREILDLVDAVNAAGHRGFEVVGLVAEPAPAAGPIDAYGVPFLGPPQVIDSLADDIGYLIGIGDPQARRRLDEQIGRRGRLSPVLVHPTANVGRNTVFGPGTVVCSHVSITNHVTLGRHVHLNRNATVGHDVVVGDGTLVGPMAALSGNVTVGAGVYIGASSSIRERITVGENAVIGMGAAVVTDVAPGVTVVGVPAAPLPRSS